MHTRRKGLLDQPPPLRHFWLPVCSRRKASHPLPFPAGCVTIAVMPGVKAHDIEEALSGDKEVEAGARSPPAGNAAEAQVPDAGPAARLTLPCGEQWHAATDGMPHAGTRHHPKAWLRASLSTQDLPPPAAPQSCKDQAASEEQHCCAENGMPATERGAERQQPSSGGEEEAVDLPFDAPFAPLRPPFDFWQDAVLLSLLGGALGAFG